MPIVFAPPEPIRPDISTGYGASQQWSQDAPMLQRQQQGIAEAYLQSASLQQRAAQASQQMQLQAHEHMASLDQQRANQQGHFALAQQQMGHQSDMQAQHASLQDQLAQNQLSRGETLRLQRLQEARGTIQDQVANGTLTASEGNDALMQIQTGISPLQMRQQRAQQQHMELQNQQLQRQTAQFDNLERQRNEYRSQNAQDHIEVVTDPNTGEDYTFHRAEDGRRTFMGSRGSNAAVWHPGQEMQSGGPGGGSPGSSRGRVSPQPNEAGELPFNPAVHARALAQAERESPRDELGHARPVTRAAVNEIYNTMMGMGQQQEQRGPSRQQITADVWQSIQSNPAMASLPIAQQRQMRDREVARQMAVAQQPIEERRQANAQVDQGVNQMVEAMPEGVRAQVRAALNAPAVRDRMRATVLQGLRQQPLRQATTPQGFPILNPGPGQQEGAAPPPPTPLRASVGEAESSRPFTTEEIGSLSGPQRTVATQLNGLREDIAAANVHGSRRQELAGMLNDAQALITEFGSVRSMPPPTKRRYDHLLAVISRSLTPAAMQPARPRGDESFLETMGRLPRRANRALSGLMNQMDPGGGYSRPPDPEE